MRPNDFGIATLQDEYTERAVDTLQRAFAGARRAWLEREAFRLEWEAGRAAELAQLRASPGGQRGGPRPLPSGRTRRG